MKKLLTLVLCWLIAFSAMAETTLKAKTALSASGGFITSQNKVDGSFEDGISSWSASVGTIVKTASTEIQGNNIGVWSGTGTETLDLQWVATASNTYTASVQVKLDVPADYSFCAVVNDVETGCKSLAGYTANKIYKLQVDADSVIGTGFYLRLKHTGSGSFSAIIDDGKIEPFSPQYVQTATGTSVIQSYQDGTEWKSLTYTEVNALSGNQGLGAFTAGGVEWKKEGGDLLYKGKLTIGTVSGLEARIPLPASLLSASTAIIPTYAVVGYGAKSMVGGSTYSVIQEPSVGYLNIGVQTSTLAGLNKHAGTTLFNNGETFSFNARIPIAGWSSSPTLLALPNGTEVDYTIEAAGNGGQTINGTDIPFIATRQDGFIWDGSGFTAPFDCEISIEGGIRNTLAPGYGIISAYINGSGSRTLGTTNNGTQYTPFSGSIKLLKGQRLSIRMSVSGQVLSNDTAGHWLKIIRINGRIDKTFVGNVAKDYTAYIDSSETITGATDNFITSCTNADPSVCTFATNKFGTAPYCNAQKTSSADVYVTTTSSTSVTIERADASSTFSLFCQIK